MGLRIMAHPEARGLSSEALSIILRDDVEKVKLTTRRPLPNRPVDENLLSKALHELDSLIGMQNIKKYIRELVNLVRL